ncbi:MAG: hypothetical protein KME42_09790 [Tildeniella nuda ZEHNDER 1965/U140]|jgi:hypothetical protein|nr:hypothetical protein [Tildeniella nuda ZEHNDER 1965/U140]
MQALAKDGVMEFSLPRLQELHGYRESFDKDRNHANLGGFNQQLSIAAYIVA